MKDYSDFLSWVESPEGQEAVYAGTPELMDPRLHAPVDLHDPDSAADFFNRLHRCSVRSTLNLLRLYHEWRQDP